MLADWITRMGQDLFYPPNVGGWAEGRAWLGSRSLIARANFATALAAGRLWSSPSAVDLGKTIRDRWPEADLEHLVGNLAETLWGERLDDPIEQSLLAADAESPADQLPVALGVLLTHAEAHLG
jgi:hypothetical protein